MPPPPPLANRALYLSTPKHNSKSGIGTEPTSLVGFLYSSLNKQSTGRYVIDTHIWLDPLISCNIY